MEDTQQEVQFEASNTKGILYYTISTGCFFVTLLGFAVIIKFLIKLFVIL